MATWWIWASAIAVLHVVHCSNAVPIINTHGTYFEVGKDVGRTFQGQIQEYYDWFSDLKTKYLPWSKTSGGRKIMNGYFDVINSTYPEYISEMLGLAEGANVTFTKVFLMNLRREINTLIPKSSPTIDHCTDVHVNFEKTVAFGHNEDADAFTRNNSYFVRAYIKDPALKSKPENFTIYTYPGLLPGNAFGFNSAGLAFSVNGLYPVKAMLGKHPRNILTRAMYTAGNMDELRTILQDVGVGSAYGMSVNVGDVKNGSMWNIEVAPQIAKEKSIYNLYQILPHSTSKPGNYFHVNTYRRVDIDQIPNTSSKHRTARIEQMGLPCNVSGIMNILGDTADKENPIYRQYTVATGLFDIKNGKLHIYLDNPKTSKGPAKTFDMSAR